MEKIILLSGKAENGKSTTAKIMKEELEKQGKKVFPPSMKRSTSVTYITSTIGMAS